MNAMGPYRLLCLSVVGVNIEPDACCLLPLSLLLNMLIQGPEVSSSPVL